MSESSHDRIDKIGQLRNQVRERIPDAKKTLIKSGVPPSYSGFGRIAINIAGKSLRDFLKISDKAETDSLTGLMIRQRFERRLEEEVGRARRNGSRLTLLIFDLDELKETNDGPGGHKAGDELLKSVANSLKEVSRISDIISRYGGDEFYVLLPETDINGGISYWEKLNEVFKKKDIRISTGISEVALNDVEGSTQRTDEAMYKSKKLSKENGLNVLAVAGRL